MPPNPERRIVHADLDAFYAAVEQRDRPELRGVPVIVGGRPEARGVVATASYEARRFGARSAMPTRTALRLCPQAILIAPDFAKYHAVSRQVFTIYADWTPIIEPLSLDEAYLDLTEMVTSFDAAVVAAHAIREQVRREVGLAVSVGVGTTKLVAKIASDLAKPDGMRVVRPGTEREFLWPQPVTRVWGIGPKTAAILRGWGIDTIADLAARSEAELTARFGRVGRYWHDLSQGLDARPVESERRIRQISRETTFAADVADATVVGETLARLAGSVAGSLQQEGLRGRTVTLKLRFEDFRTISRQATVPRGIDDAVVLADQGQRLLQLAWEPGRKLRLVGIGVSNFSSGEAWQLRLFEANLW